MLVSPQIGTRLYQLFETGWYLYTYGNQISALTAVFSDLTKVFYVFYDLELWRFIEQVCLFMGFLIFDVICIIIYFVKMLILGMVTVFSANTFWLVLFWSICSLKISDRGSWLAWKMHNLECKLFLQDRLERGVLAPFILPSGCDSYTQRQP